MDEEDRVVLQCCVCSKVACDPVLLQCLHNCCRQCMPPGSQGQMTCPACHDLTDVTIAKANGFLRARALALHIATAADGPSCSICSDDNGKGGSPSEPTSAAEALCRHCGKSLCGSCAADHARHASGHELVRQEDVGFIGLCRALAGQCQAHSRPLDYHCTTCSGARCIECARICVNRSHRLLSLNDGAFADAAREAAEDVRRLVGTLERGVPSLLGRHRDVEGTINAARTARRAELQRNKSAVLCAVERAYATACARLEEMCDEALQQAAELGACHERLRARAEPAAAYGTLLAESGDATSTLDQRALLIGRLQQLVNEMQQQQQQQPWQLLAAAAACRQNEASSENGGGWRRAIVIESSVKTDPVDDLCASWVGMPKFCSDADVAQQTGQGCGSEEQTARNLLLTSTDAGSCSGSSSGGGGFVSAIVCCDVAVTSHGTVLLAALKQGLVEFDCDGRELSRWRPTPADSAPKRGEGREGGRSATATVAEVYTVDVLDDGRVVVGLDSPRCLLLSRRHRTPSTADGADAAAADGVAPVAVALEKGCNDVSSGGSDVEWLADGRGIALRSYAHRLSAGGDLLAIAESGFPVQLVVVAVACGHELFRLRCDFIFSLAVVADAACVVVTASESRVKLDDGRELHVVDAYGPTGDRLWRQAFDEQIYDISTAAAAAACWTVPAPAAAKLASDRRVLYLTLGGSDRLVAVAVAADGVAGLGEIARWSCAALLKKPDRLSVRRIGARWCARGAGDTMLAVLGWDGKTVAIRRASPGGQVPRGALRSEPIA